MRLNRELSICVIVGIGAFVAWVGWSVFETSNQALPSSVVDLPTFMSTMPTPDALNRIEVRGSSYYEAVGPMASTLAAPSGPPVYIFGDDLTVMDWTIDIGDDPSFEARWSADSRRELSDAELKELLAAPGSMR